MAAAFVRPIDSGATVVLACDAVAAAVDWHIRGRGSERELVNREAHTWTLREGRIARFEWGQDLGTALEAAGFPD